MGASSPCTCSSTPNRSSTNRCPEQKNRTVHGYLCELLIRLALVHVARSWWRHVNAAIDDLAWMLGHPHVKCSHARKHRVESKMITATMVCCQNFHCEHVRVCLKKKTHAMPAFKTSSHAVTRTSDHKTRSDSIVSVMMEGDISFTFATSTQPTETIQTSLPLASTECEKTR